jgi:hypothetical protein
MTLGEWGFACFKKTQFVEQVTHCFTPAGDGTPNYLTSIGAELACNIRLPRGIMIDLG